MARFNLETPFPPAGDQPAAIEKIVSAFTNQDGHQVLLGVTGSGKTFTMANVIQRLGRPTLVISHNKTLAAQLYQELKSFFPSNAVEYFVSYYDYYQPEAYVAASDTYIEKDSSINEEIDKLRLRTTASMMTRDDIVVVASVSCIYGLGSPQEYREMMVEIRLGEEKDRQQLLRELVDIHYSRNDYDFKRGTFRVRGDVVEIRPAYDDFAYRIEFFGDEIEKLSRIDILTGEIQAEPDHILIYPARHYVTREENMERIVRDIEKELKQRAAQLEKDGKLLEAQRINTRTRYDMEMLKEVGFCPGVENYSRIIENRAEGTPPWTLMDFFGKDYLLILDESHVTIPQIGGMYAGDRSRKQSLVEHGFRLPSAMDNRPLKFPEFESHMPDSTLYVSATPADYELKRTGGEIVEQIIRPTGLLDPEVEIFPSKGQIDRVLSLVQERTGYDERTLITTLTKRSAEDLTDFLKTAGIKVSYMHSDTDTLKRMEIIRQLRQGKIDVLVGINLLREGLDIPEVSLVIILDADKEGFLRSERSLIQTIGRAARNVRGKVVLFADRVTDSMKKAMGETANRRKKQHKFNIANSISPKTITKSIHASIQLDPEIPKPPPIAEPMAEYSPQNIPELEERMQKAAENLEFEEAARLRDLIERLKGGKK